MTLKCWSVFFFISFRDELNFDYFKFRRACGIFLHDYIRVLIMLYVKNIQVRLIIIFCLVFESFGSRNLFFVSKSLILKEMSILIFYNYFRINYRFPLVLYDLLFVSFSNGLKGITSSHAYLGS